LGRLGLTEIYAITALCRCLVGRRYASREVTVTRNYWTANHPTDKSFSRAVYQEEAEFETELTAIVLLYPKTCGSISMQEKSMFSFS